ncbi:MAG TPA: hypothetical protein DEB39_04760 [Planctomycetaceae bacterium]|nr:hypothetical protein [Planctomycetaceae bacterium]
MKTPGTCIPGCDHAANKSDSYGPRKGRRAKNGDAPNAAGKYQTRSARRALPTFQKPELILETR